MQSEENKGMWSRFLIAFSIEKQITHHFPSVQSWWGYNRSFFFFHRESFNSCCILPYWHFPVCLVLQLVFVCFPSQVFVSHCGSEQFVKSAQTMLWWIMIFTGSLQLILHAVFEPRRQHTVCWERVFVISLEWLNSPRSPVEWPTIKRPPILEWDWLVSLVHFGSCDHGDFI